MTESNYGSNFGNWVGEVVNRDDPLKAGRTQIRIRGVHDDTSQIPDKDLPWHPSPSLSPAGNPALNHFGWSPNGMMVGTTVHGIWSDKDKTIPIVIGVVNRAQIEEPKGSQVKQSGNTSIKNDIAWNARGDQKTGVQGETNLGKDYIEIIKQSSHQKAEDAEKDKSIPKEYKKPKFSKQKTVASTAYKDGQKMLNLIKQVDPQNESGAIKPALETMRGMKNITSMAGSLLGGNQFSSLFNGLLQESGGGGGNQQQQNPQNLLNTLMNDPSSIDVGEGTSTDSPVAQTNSEISTSNNSNQSQGGGNDSGGGGMGSAVGMIQGLISQMMQGVGGQKGGLASFDTMQGKIKMLEDQFKKLNNNSGQGQA